MNVKHALAAYRLRLALRVSRLNRALNEVTPAVCEKLFFFGGLSALVYGCWLIYRPAGPIVGGLLGIWLACLISAERH